MNAKEYSIDVAIKQNGVQVPAGVRLLIKDMQVRPNRRGDSWIVTGCVQSYSDGTYANHIDNDIFPGDRYEHDLNTTTYPSTGAKTLIKNAINAALDAHPDVGSGNYTEDPA